MLLAFCPGTSPATGGDDICSVPSPIDGGGMDGDIDPGIGSEDRAPCARAAAACIGSSAIVVCSGLRSSGSAIGSVVGLGFGAVDARPTDGAEGATDGAEGATDGAERGTEEAGGANDGARGAIGANPVRGATEGELFFGGND